MSLVEVAKRAKVSIATASRVLSSSAYPVSEALRQRVLEAAEEFNYVPNANARALQQRESSAVGVIVGDVRDPYFAEIVHGIQTVADRQGRLVYICSSQRDPRREIDYVRLLRSHSVSAIILTGSGLTDPAYVRQMEHQLDAFRAAGGVVAAVGRHLVRGRKVLPDNEGGARALAGALVALGHRRFGILSGPRGVTSTEERTAGFLAGLAGAGLDPAAVPVVEGDYSRESGAAAARALLGAETGITCIFAMNDHMAIGALRHLRAHGVRVPQDISIAGFDDVASAAEASPALTTVSIGLAEMSARVATVAFAGGEDLPDETAEIIPATLVMRDSTAAPRRAKMVRLHEPN